MKEGADEGAAELRFEEDPDPLEPIRRSKSSFIKRWLLISVGVGAAVAGGLYWLAR